MAIYRIKKHVLTEDEILTLITSIRRFPDLTYVSAAQWRKIPSPYCIFVDGKFAGVCCTHETKHWVKPGPLLVLPEFQGQGLGRKLFTSIVAKQQKSICVISSCPILQHLTVTSGFTEQPHIYALPGEVQHLLIKQLLEYLSIPYIVEGIRKQLLLKRGKVKVFTKTNRKRL